MGVADFKLSSNILVMSWSQGNGESLFSLRSLAAPLGFFFFPCRENLCCIAPGRMSIILGMLSHRTGLEHFLQICEVHVLNRGFECWHKSWIQFVLHSAKRIFFFFKKKILLAFKASYNEAGYIRVTIRKWGSSYL